MNNYSKGITILLMSVGVLTACGEHEDQSSETSSTNEESTEQVTGETNDSDGLPEKSEFGSDNKLDKSEPALEESIKDQLDLRIGDSGQINTTLDTFEVTLHSVKFEESINGKTPERESFIIADITLKNLAQDPLTIQDALGVLEITGGLDIAGGSDYSHYYDAIEPMEGELKGGQEINGQLLFEENKFEEYYIRVTEGLIAAGGAKNQAIWTFTREEAE